MTKENYKLAQSYAGRFESCGASRNGYSIFGCDLDSAIADVITLGTFASEVAKTIKAGIEKYGTPRVSSKQAWIIACAWVEMSAK